MSDLSEIVILASAFLLALSKIFQKGLPLLSKVLNNRNSHLVKIRSEANKKLKAARKKYEEANISYFNSFDRKVSWVTYAKERADQEIEQLKQEYGQKMQALDEEYVNKERDFEQEAELARLNKLFSEFEIELKKYEISDFSKIKIH